MANALILKRLASHFKMNMAEFYRMIGDDSESVKRAVAREAHIPYEAIPRIRNKFPEVNPMWLYAEEGEMLIQKNSEENNGGNTLKKPDEDQSGKINFDLTSQLINNDELMNNPLLSLLAQIVENNTLLAKTNAKMYDEILSYKRPGRTADPERSESKRKAS